MVATAPAVPGRYRLTEPGGLVRTVKVIERDGELFAVVPTGWIFAAAVPVTEIDGTWAGPA